MNSKALIVSKVCLGLLAVAFLAAAQSSTGIAHVKIPHDVRIGSVTAPAGDYAISVVNTGSDSQVLLFQSATGFTTVVLAARVPAPDDRGDKTELVLSQHDGNYRLEKIWIGGKSYGYEVLHRSHR